MAILDEILGKQVRDANQDMAASLYDYYFAGRRYFNFSLANYLIYNVKFILRGDFQFLPRNPDKYVIKRMMTADSINILQEIKKIVFPVIII